MEEPHRLLLQTPLGSSSMVGERDHQHKHGPSATSSQRATRKLWIASGLCFAFFIVELVGGLISGSLAILSDSFHLLSDLSGFLISLFSIYLAQQKATKKHSFGFHRAEIIGAMVSVFLIWVVTGVLFKEAVDRVRNPQPINGGLMMIIALMGLVVNFILVFALGHGHDHDHGDHSHGHGHEHGSDEEQGTIEGAHGHQHHNVNLQAAIIHVIGDIISSVGVVISSIVVYYRPDLTIVDPICTFIFSLIVLLTTYTLIRDSLTVLMEGTPAHIDPHSVEADLLNIEGVVGVHDLHIWTLTIGQVALAVHIEVHDTLSMARCDKILKDAESMICSKYSVHHSTVQLESFRSAYEGHCRSSLCNGGICNTNANGVGATDTASVALIYGSDIGSHSSRKSTDDRSHTYDSNKGRNSDRDDLP